MTITITFQDVAGKIIATSEGPHVPEKGSMVIDDGTYYAVQRVDYPLRRSNFDRFELNAAIVTLERALEFTEAKPAADTAVNTAGTTSPELLFLLDKAEQEMHADGFISQKTINAIALEKKRLGI